MSSLRRALLTGSAVATVLIFTVAAIAFYFVARTFLINEVDSSLRAKVRVIASMVEFAPGGRVGVDGGDLARFPEYSVAPADAARAVEFYQIDVANGGGRALSPSVRAFGTLELVRQASKRESNAFITLPDGQRGRVVSLKTATQMDPDELVEAGFTAPPAIIVTAARNTVELDRLLRNLRRLLAVTCLGGAAALVIANAVVIRRALRPVARLAGDIAKIGPRDLGARLAPSATSSELGPIVQRLNELLDRVHSAMNRETRFTADAAHELRTPLAGLSSALEICANRERSPEEYQRVIGECRHAVSQMVSTVDNMLLLARADGARLALNRRAVDLQELLRDTWTRHASTARRRQLCVELEIDEPLVAETDPSLLVIVVNNLMDNAVDHADAKGSIRISVRESGPTIEVQISNTGSRVSAEEVPRLFERFHRGDPSRSGDGRHCGLGLAVVQQLVAALGVSIRIDSTLDGEFMATIAIPAKPAANAPHVLQSTK